MHLPPLRVSVVVAALALAGLAGVPTGFVLASADQPVTMAPVSAVEKVHTVTATQIKRVTRTSVRVELAAKRQTTKKTKATTTTHRKNRTRIPTTTTAPPPAGGVTPGAFCGESNANETATGKNGIAYVCSDSNSYRWVRKESAPVTEEEITTTTPISRDPNIPQATGGPTGNTTVTPRSSTTMPPAPPLASIAVATQETPEGVVED